MSGWRNTMKRIAFVLSVAVLLLCAGPVAAETVSVPSEPVGVEKLNDHLLQVTVATPFEVKLVASFGGDGILLVDTGLLRAADAVLGALRKSGEGEVRFLVNTHYHDDHTGGNAVFGKTAVIIAQENTRKRMTTGLALLRELPAAALPEITFDSGLTLYFNGEAIRLIHIPNGHTDGDTIVHFTKSGVVYVGDLLFPDKFPYVDFRGGGRLDGYLENLDTMAGLFPEDTVFIAAHGRGYKAGDIRAYRNELGKTVGLVRAALKEGKTVDELRKSEILKPWDSWGTSFISAAAWLGTIDTDMHRGNEPPKESLIGPLFQVLVTGDGEAAVRLYRELEKNEPSRYDFNEVEINALGYYLLGKKRTGDAIALFRLNVEEHPESFNTYDSLGEAYMNAGQKDLAVKNYRKSLELNSANSNAVEMLKKLEANPGN
jgi:cyclase